jgi:hypothetical protein
MVRARVSVRARIRGRGRVRVRVRARPLDIYNELRSKHPAPYRLG